MFDIKIGTLIPADMAPAMIKQLNPKGFECYELDFNSCADALLPDIGEHAKRVLDVLDGRSISALGRWSNTLTEESTYRQIVGLIKAAPLFGSHIVGLFAGGDSGKSVPDSISLFKKKFTELCKIAEENDVKLALEGCGGGWWECGGNIAFNSCAWDLIFDAVPSPALGLEWEPAHAYEHLADPIPQLRRYADKVFHVHGKDATVAWDIIRDYGTDCGKDFCWNRTPGFGDTNWSDIFTILLQAGFEGACDIEGYHDPVHYDDMEWTAQVTSMEYLKRCRGGMEYFPGPVEYRGYQGARKKESN